MSDEGWTETKFQFQLKRETRLEKRADPLRQIPRYAAGA